MAVTVLDQAAMAVDRVPQDREVVAVLMTKIIQPLQVGLVQFLFQYQMERQYQQVALPYRGLEIQDNTIMVGPPVVVAEASNSIKI
jgi:hypothetical protein